MMITMHITDLPSRGQHRPGAHGGVHVRGERGRARGR